MSMFYLFFGIEKKEFCQKKILLGVKQNGIDMYVGEKQFKYVLFVMDDLKPTE